MHPKLEAVGNFPYLCQGIDRSVFTVPAFATTQNGISPAPRSAVIFATRSSVLILKLSSTATSRTFSRPMPRRAAAFAMEKWVSLDA